MPPLRGLPSSFSHPSAFNVLSVSALSFILKDEGCFRKNSCIGERRGECPGELLHQRAGEGGFGYDPLFRYHTGKTFAEMTEKEKNAVSHRAVAAEKMRGVLMEAL